MLGPIDEGNNTSYYIEGMRSIFFGHRSIGCTFSVALSQLVYSGAGSMKSVAEYTIPMESLCMVEL